MINAEHQILHQFAQLRTQTIYLHLIWAKHRRPTSHVKHVAILNEELSPAMLMQLLTLRHYTCIAKSTQCHLVPKPLAAHNSISTYMLIQ